eukprot:TRINITY_DN8698_c0_g1_i1.p1 TRINITY_DN8698_c0_g1~~TRINITY_DN8698_c0_g1_i1.p1  ORF type:complete len:680 (+),score=221.09 TRINITY_DN8698_c0_g1_i1:1191-3230(+)
MPSIPLLDTHSVGVHLLVKIVEERNSLDDHDVNLIGRELQSVTTKGVSETELHVVHLCLLQTIVRDESVKLEANATEELLGRGISDWFDGTELLADGLTELLISDSELGDIFADDILLQELLKGGVHLTLNDGGGSRESLGRILELLERLQADHLLSLLQAAEGAVKLLRLGELSLILHLEEREARRSLFKLTMLVLYETPAGFALFQMKDEGKLSKPEKLYGAFSSLEKAKKMVSLKSFKKFQDTAEALSAATAIVEGKMDSTLEQFLKKNVVGKDVSKLAVADKKLGQSIREKFGSIEPVTDTSAQELFRCIRFQLNGLISDNGLEETQMHNMQLGLAHSLGRYRLKFSPDKVDVMIVQAISLLDDLDKEVNTYAMRVKEWYGWHFPELVRIVNDNMAYSRLVIHLGLRKNVDTLDVSDVLEESVAEVVTRAAKTSMGTDISDDDIAHVQSLATQVIEISEYREELYEYIKNRMRAIAPNLTVLVGELVGARLIAHAGSLINLAKHPASTIQILGAEKALFRALKSKKATPKYGLIYHASLVGQSQPKTKGKISRVLANKASLSIRFDALGDNSSTDLGMKGLEFVVSKIQEYDGKMPNFVRPDTDAFAKYTAKSSSGAYNPTDDVVMEETPLEDDADKKKKKRKKSSDKGEKKSRKRKRDDDDEDEGRASKKKKRS